MIEIFRRVCRQVLKAAHAQSRYIVHVEGGLGAARFSFSNVLPMINGDVVSCLLLDTQTSPHLPDECYVGRVKHASNNKKIKIKHASNNNIPTTHRKPQYIVDRSQPTPHETNTIMMATPNNQYSIPR